MIHNTCNSLSTAKMNGLNTSRYGKGRLDQPKGIGLQCARMISIYEHLRIEMKD